MTEPSIAVPLSELVAVVERAHADPLERLSGAVALAGQLGDVADQLVGHFVEQARLTGASWKEVGASMGVSKQAVQQRFATRPAPPLHASQGFSRFTAQARAAVVSAQEEARAAGHAQITVNHLLLGLTSDPHCGAAAAIVEQGIDLDLVRRTARATTAGGAAEVPALIPFDPHAKDALERTFTEAVRAGHDQVGTEHLLLAVLSVEDGTGVLAGLGLDQQRVERGLGDTPR